MSELQSIKLADLHASPFNPRKSFDKTSLDELADSIRTSGVLSPLLVRENAAGYEIVAGERRFRAAKLVGLKEVPCIVRKFESESEVRRAQIIENLQREDVAPIEEAQGFQDLLKEIGDGGEKAAVKGIAEQIGKSVRHVYARLQLLGLSEPVKKAVEAGKLLAGHAQELVPLKPEQQKEMLKRITAQAGGGYPMTVDEIREEIKYNFAEKPKAPPIPAKELERRKRELEAQKKREAAYKTQQAKREAERKRDEEVRQRAVAALWPKLKAEAKRKRERFLDDILSEAAREVDIASAWAVRDGKKLPTGVRWNRDAAIYPKFAKLPTSERIALIRLAIAIDATEYDTKGEDTLLRWAGIDRKKIATELLAEEKAKTKPAAKVQTSAKPAPKKAKAKKRAAKRKAKK